MRLGRAALAVSFALSCSEPKRAPPPGQHASPNASILPAPLAAASELTAPQDPRPPAPDAAPADSAGRIPPAPPSPLVLDRPLSADSLATKELAGYELVAELRFGDLPGPPTFPEVATSALRELASETVLRVTVDLALAGRMRLVFDASGFPVPPRTELRARSSYYGHVLVWPDGGTYRNVQPGALRALLEEGRLDVSPLLRTKVAQSGTGSRLSRRTTLTTLETSLGALSLEQAVLPSATGGDLLCRLLAELVGADPSTEACRPERIPVFAQYRFGGTGALAFVVTSLAEKKDLAPATLLTPPEEARFVRGELPVAPLGALVAPERLARIRTRAAGGSTPAGKELAETSLDNQTAVLQYLFVDGVAVACVRPRSRAAVPGLLRGKYTVFWRDLFGALAGQAEVVDLPDALRVGGIAGDGGS